MGARPPDEAQAFFAARAATWDARFPDDDLLDRRNLEPQLERHGWTLISIDDSEDRYLAVATRT